MRATQSEGPDKVLVMPTRFGLGFMLPRPEMPMAGPASFGHDGAGGSLGFADPDTGVGFGYVMNKMIAGLGGDPRTLALTAAIRGCLS